VTLADSRSEVLSRTAPDNFFYGPPLNKYGFTFSKGCITKMAEGWRRQNHGNASGRPCHRQAVEQVLSSAHGLRAREVDGSIQVFEQGARGIARCGLSK
jgi:hypothetical protein